MGLSIKKRETVDAVRQLAALTGESLTDAVHTAVIQRLKSCGTRAGVTDADELEAFFAEIHGGEILDDRPYAELEAELYDENGLPR